ncbi:hypothetical protein FIBSPDRAFT_954943 [Athelia psychrophila]|uniref:Uncharacterized protein n=1 Tax=Athelia psychrophila TaxID=1759441 RepID=A0A166IRT4_9AGAM|nr:hypothetical protein FIBSPDRAFT_954943 [Fibularhizoctonia sp. CBS 109695]
MVSQVEHPYDLLVLKCPDDAEEEDDMEGVPDALDSLPTSSEVSEASILDLTAECIYYEYAPVIAANKSFPELWQSAIPLTAGSTAGNAMWN